jgi:hypothetical protein
MVQYALLERDTSFVGQILWHSIAPNYNAFFLIVTGLWFYHKANAATEPLEKKAYQDSGFSLVVWGLFNVLMYFLLHVYQKIYIIEP